MNYDPLLNSISIRRAIRTHIVLSSNRLGGRDRTEYGYTIVYGFPALPNPKIDGNTVFQPALVESRLYLNREDAQKEVDRIREWLKSWLDAAKKETPHD